MVDHELTEDEEWQLMTWGYGSEATYLSRALPCNVQQVAEVSEGKEG